MRARAIFFVGCFMMYYTTNGQQLPQFTQYMYNTVSINPAYAGSREALNITLLHRNQWAGIEANPRTGTLSLHGPLKFSNVSLGLSYIGDKLGYERTNYIYGDFSYKVPVDKAINLAFGIKAGATNYHLVTPDDSDPFFNDGFTQWAPNIGAGIYLSSRMWYVGASVPKILNTDLNQGEFLALERRSYYGIAGIVFDLSERVKFKPTALAKVTDGAPEAYDITASILYNEKLWVGFSYRFNNSDSFGAYFDYQISPSFRIGYAYDLPTSAIRPYSSGTHEFILIFENRPRWLGGIKSPRYF